MSNNIVAIALSNNELMRLDLSNPSEIDRKYAKKEKKNSQIITVKAHGYFL